MSDIDPQSLSEQAVRIGLLTREQAREARADAEDGTLESLKKSLLRKQFLTGWQFDRMAKGETSGFVYGGCKVLFHIAEGTFARVYRGVKIHGNQPVAIKVLRQRFVSDPEAVERFNKEAEAGLKLVHPNIVQIYDYGEDDKRHYMTMEYVEGSNLRDFLKIRGRIDPGQALPLMLGLAHGLKYSLDQGVTHRDIKGTNILIASNGEAKLVDFGLATINDERKVAVVHNQRTVDYSALERTCRSTPGDPRSDIYFLGCVYYQMLTGQLPLPEVETKDPLAKMLKRSFGAIKPLSEMRYAPPEELARIIEKMMKMDLRARYQSMGEVVDDLEAFRESQSATAPGDGPRRPAGRAASGGEFEGDLYAEAFGTKSAEPKCLLCVERQPEIQDAFRKTFSKMGYRVVLVGDAGRAAERFREAPPDAVIFDADGLGPEGIAAFLDMHEKAHEDGFELAAVVILGPKQRGHEDELPDDDRLVVLNKPIKLKDVQEALTLLVPAG